MCNWLCASDYTLCVKKTGTAIHMATSTWFFVLMAYSFCHIDYDLFPINCVIFNKIPHTVYEIQMFKNDTVVLTFSICTSLAAPVWLTVRRIVWSQSGHCFHKHTPSIEHAIAWWHCQWFPVGNGATLDQFLFQLFHVVNPALVDALLERIPNLIVNRV